MRAKHKKYAKTEKANARARYAEDPEKYRKQAADWRTDNPEKARKVSRESQAKLRRLNPEKKRQRDRDFIKRHPG